MTRRGVAFALLLCAGVWSSTARAGNRAERRAFARGTELARRGRFRQAIAEFKKADAAEPQAKHDCYIALAYRRLRKWGLAELYLSRCVERSGTSAAMPRWEGRLRRDITAGIRHSGLVRVGIRVEPPTPAARITVSAFGRDESFAPRAVYLPRGTQVVTVRAAGRSLQQKKITIGGGGAHDVVIHLAAERPAKAPARAGVKAPARAGVKVPAPAGHANRRGSGGLARRRVSRRRHPASTRRPRLALADRTNPTPGLQPAAQVGKSAGGGASTGTWVALGLGAAALASGVTFHVLAYSDQGKLADAHDLAEYRKYEGPYDRERALAYTSYAIAAVSVGTGLYLYFHDHHRDSHSQSVTVSGGTDGRTALVQLTWTH